MAVTARGSIFCSGLLMKLMKFLKSWFPVRKPLSLPFASVFQERAGPKFSRMVGAVAPKVASEFQRAVPLKHGVGPTRSFPAHAAGQQALVVHVRQQGVLDKAAQVEPAPAVAASLHIAEPPQRVEPGEQARLGTAEAGRGITALAQPDRQTIREGHGHGGAE